jgi:hypothetical protein
MESEVRVMETPPNSVGGKAHGRTWIANYKQEEKVEGTILTLMAGLKRHKVNQKHEEMGSSKEKRRWKRMVCAGRMIGNTQGTYTNKQQKKRLKTVHNKSIKLNQGSTGC